MDSFDSGGVFLPACRLSAVRHSFEQVFLYPTWGLVPENAFPHVTQVIVNIFAGVVGPCSFLACDMRLRIHRFEQNLVFFLLRKSLPHIPQTISTGRGFDVSFHCLVFFLRRHISLTLWFLN